MFAELKKLFSQVEDAAKRFEAAAIAYEKSEEAFLTKQREVRKMLWGYTTPFDIALGVLHISIVGGIFVGIPLFVMLAYIFPDIFCGACWK